MQTSQRNFVTVTIVAALIGAAGLIIAAYIGKPQTSNEANYSEKKFIFAGTVIDEKGRGISYAEIQLSGRTEHYVTESDGNFRFEVSMNDGQYEKRIRFIVSHKGYQAKNESVTLPAEDVVIKLPK